MHGHVRLEAAAQPLWLTSQALSWQRQGQKYTKGMKSSGIVWDNEVMFNWLTNPKSVVKGTNSVKRLEPLRLRAAHLRLTPWGPLLGQWRGWASKRGRTARTLLPRLGYEKPAI